MAFTHKDDIELIPSSRSSVIFGNTAEEISIGLDYSDENNDTSLPIDTVKMIKYIIYTRA